MTEALFDSLFWSLVWQTVYSVFQMFQIQDGGDAYFPADERQSTNPLPPFFYILILSFPVTPVPLPPPPPGGLGTRIWKGRKSLSKILNYTP